jgi:hypothetical protein
MATPAPGYIVKQFMDIWEMPVSDLERCADRIRKEIAETKDILTRLAKQTALGTFTHEIERRAKVAAKRAEGFDDPSW